MSFGTPQALWLLGLVPVVAAVAAGLWRRRLAAGAAWAAPGLWPRLLAGYRPRRLVASVALLAVAVLGLVLALAQPRWGQGEETVELRGVDVVFVLDSSLSMAAEDVRPNRLMVAKALVRRLLGGLPGHRLALVQAEGEAAVLVPLTHDSAILDLLLDTVEPGSLPRPGTRLAAALATALRLFPDGGDKHRVLVLVSDGEDHGGGLEAEGDRLREAGVVAHVLGVGTREGAPVRVPGGKPGEVRRDESGEAVISRLEEDGLESLAGVTGGLYLPVAGAAADPTAVLARIGQMEKRTLDNQTLRTLEERFQWPLAGTALALALYLGLGSFASVSQEGRP